VDVSHSISNLINPQTAGHRLSTGDEGASSPYNCSLEGAHDDGQCERHASS
jgi:hypothetical protein